MDTPDQSGCLALPGPGDGACQRQNLKRTGGREQARLRVTRRSRLPHYQMSALLRSCGKPSDKIMARIPGTYRRNSQFAWHTMVQSLGFSSFGESSGIFMNGILQYDLY